MSGTVGVGAALTVPIDASGRLGCDGGGGIALENILSDMYVVQIDVYTPFHEMIRTNYGFRNCPKRELYGPPP